MALPPSIVAAFQAALLSGLSNFLAQILAAWKASKPFELAIAPILRFFIFTLVTTPPNYKWQAFLERSFPTYPTVSLRESKKTDDISLKEKAPVSPIGAPGVPVEPGRINKGNIARKLLLDQGCAGPINNAIFIIGMGVLNGNPWEQIQWNLGRDFWRFQFAGWKLWPLVALISFSVVPFERRVLFGSLVSLGWTIYLSLLIGEV
ncbi:hypothetical protein TWF694_010720 [Orbilia ellipsospora]|uniref:Uncharacterized protein n=1 Tax=Orbilia ellipsospora TaxID=2528407 RepID=A0AAV9X9T7_9PEZI